MGNGNVRFVLRGTRTRRPVMIDADDILALFKDEIFQLAFLPRFTEV